MQGQDVRAPHHRAVAVGQGEGDVGGAQPGQDLVLVGGAHPGDREHRARVAARLVHHVVQRPARVHDLVGEAGEVLQGGVVHEDHPQPCPAGRVQDRFGPRVGLTVVGAQHARVQYDRPGHLQLAQPLRGAHQYAGAGERGAQDGVEGGGAVTGGLRRTGEDRLRRLAAVVLDQEGGRRAQHAARGGVGGVLLGGGLAQRRTSSAVGREADAAGRAQLVVHRVEGGCAGHRLGHLAGPQDAVEHE